MNLKTVLIAQASLQLLFGLAFIFAPLAVLSMYGVSTDATGVGVSRLYGAAILGVGALAWFARDAAPSPAREAIVLGFLVGASVGALVSAYGQMTGQVNALGWTTVGLFAAFAAAYAYFAFARKAA